MSETAATDYLNRQLTAGRLRELLSYDPTTGVFVWLVSTSNRAPVGSVAGCPPGGTVLDIFMGSGTTAQVAEQLNRNWIGIDLDQRNEVLQRERLQQPSFELNV